MDSTGNVSVGDMQAFTFVSVITSYSGFVGDVSTGSITTNANGVLIESHGSIGTGNITSADTIALSNNFLNATGEGITTGNVQTTLVGTNFVASSFG